MKLLTEAFPFYILFYSDIILRYSPTLTSVNGVVVTWNPSKVQLGVRFPLNAHFFQKVYFENSKYRQVYVPQRKLLSDRIYCFNNQLRIAFPTRPLNV